MSGTNEGQRVKRASYRHAVAWIALNDEPTERDPGEVAEATTTSLIADIFWVTPARVAADIIRYRNKHEV